MSSLLIEVLTARVTGVARKISFPWTLLGSAVLEIMHNSAETVTHCSEMQTVAGGTREKNKQAPMRTCIKTVHELPFLSGKACPCSYVFPGTLYLSDMRGIQGAPKA